MGKNARKRHPQIKKQNKSTNPPRNKSRPSARLVKSLIAAFFTLFLGVLGNFLWSWYIRTTEPQNVGTLVAKADILLSAKDNIMPAIEFGTDLTEEGNETIQTTSLMFAGMLRYQSWWKDTNLLIRRSPDGYKVSAQIRDKSGKLIVEIIDNEWKYNNGWDRNYNRDSLEVKDSSGHIVFQIRIRPKVVQFNGILYGSNGEGVETCHVKIKSATANITTKLRQVGPGLEPEYCLKPLFKYPSEKHFGELEG